MSSPAAFSVTGTLKLGRTDAAGILYFASALELSHEAVEGFLETRGASVARLLAVGPKLPIVHTEANFKSALRVGDAFCVSVDSIEFSRKSVAFHTRIQGPSGRLIADISTTHACVDSATGKAIPLPSWLKAALTPVE